MTSISATTVAIVAAAVATVLVGAYGGRLSRTTSDFLVASRTVGPRWNAAAISGEYLSAASFLGVAGLVAKYGADALWYPVGFTAGYLGLLLFVAAPLRRSGAYTVPDFAEFRLRLRTGTHGGDARRGGDLRALPGAPVSGRGPDPENPSRRAGLGRSGGGGRDRHRQRRRRRHALDHVRAGVPVLAQAHRDRGPRPGADRVVPRRPPHAGRSAAADGDTAHHRRHRRRRGGAGRPTGRRHRGRRADCTLPAVTHCTGAAPCRWPPVRARRWWRAPPPAATNGCYPATGSAANTLSTKFFR